MVFASTCEHAGSSFTFASTSSAGSNMSCEQRALRKFSTPNLDLSLLKRNVFCQLIWLTPFNQSQQLTANCTLLAMMSNYVR